MSDAAMAAELCDGLRATHEHALLAHHDVTSSRTGRTLTSAWTAITHQGFRHFYDIQVQERRPVGFLARLGLRPPTLAAQITELSSATQQSPARQTVYKLGFFAGDLVGVGVYAYEADRPESYVGPPVPWEPVEHNISNAQAVHDVGRILDLV